jgi:glycosyltransferase involved in cell wall biosynthesis
MITASESPAVRHTLKILFVVNDARFFVSHRLALADRIRSAGYEVHLATPTTGFDSAIRAIQSASISVHPVPIDRQGINPIQDLIAFLALVRVIRFVRPHIVHNVTVKPILYGSLAARIVGVHSVVNAVSGLGRLFVGGTWLTRMRSWVVTLLYRAAFAASNVRAIFQTEDNKGAFLAARIVGENKSVVIEGSGTDLDCFNPDAAPENPPTVLMVARLLRQKGVREFVHAARMLRARGLKSRFAIAGDTADNRDALSKPELDDIRREGIVELWGWCDDIPRAIARASIICLPSYHEGVPKALLDAAAAGRPAVATRIPGCKAVVRDGVTGLLVPPRNSTALAETIERLLLDAKLRCQLGRNARRIAEERFGIDRVAQLTLAFYRQLLR